METEGLFAPATTAEARDRFETLGPSAQVVVKETAKAMDLDAESYRERVDSDVVATAREALFASLLEVHVGDRAAFESWCEDHSDYDVEEIGSENVDGVVWHAAPFSGTVVAATYHDQRRAAVDTLRRKAFAELYRDAVGGG
ncbi:hypothetical protein GJ629_09470 [Halapricum sp. CBA1109]|uniref:DUF5809 family protein n=1 Tax=Halapricum sp. CBA1109 TaxID=2668068 RepID=UPI0012FA70BE|nr:DUF5809 family protein [Halapricum sp. CBA1109]MUV90091.1 hypothetical protein [Halapricum sp. CBA1109]